MRMREYKGRKILKRIAARLVIGKNSLLPDCICLILLTEDTLYILEDDFDGTYTAHFTIPCSRIKSIESVYHINDCAKGSNANKSANAYSNANGGFSTLQRVSTSLLAGFGGVFYSPARNAGTGAGAEYLMISFVDSAGENQLIHFNEASGSISAFSNAYKKFFANKPNST